MTLLVLNRPPVEIARSFVVVQKSVVLNHRSVDVGAAQSFCRMFQSGCLVSRRRAGCPSAASDVWFAWRHPLLLLLFPSPPTVFSADVFPVDDMKGERGGGANLDGF